MIKLINKSKLSSNIISKCLEYLPNEYKTLNIDLIIFKNRFSCFIYNITHFRFRMGFFLLFKTCGGSSSRKSNKIYMYPFNYEFNNEELKQHEKYKFIHDIYHEVHHQYQQQKRKVFFNNYLKRYKKKINYNTSLIELEARRFSNKLTVKYFNEIYNLLNQ